MAAGWWRRWAGEAGAVVQGVDVNEHMIALGRPHSGPYEWIVARKAD